MIETKSNNVASNLNEDNENSATTLVSSLQYHPSVSSSLSSTSSSFVTNDMNRLPWGVFKEKQCYFLNHLNNLDINFLTLTNDSVSGEKKPGEFVMQLVMLNFVQLTSKKFDQIINGDKKEKRLKDCFQKNDDLQLDQLVQIIGNVAEQCLPSLVRFLFKWYEGQIQNLNYIKQNQPNEQNNQQTSSKVPFKVKQQQMIQAKQERDFLDERKELVINSILCIFLIEILKQLPFHPGNDDILNYIIDLSFKRFLKKDITQSVNFYAQINADNQFVTDLNAEVIGVLAQSRFALVKRRFLNEFRLKLNLSSASSTESIANNIETGSSNLNSSNTNLSTNTISSQNTTQTANLSNLTPDASLDIQSSSAQIIKLLMGMKYFRIKMVPIEDFEASFQFLNECAQHFVDTKDKDIKHALAALFFEILVPITGSVKNEVNIPCLKLFVDLLYPHAYELTAKSKHRMALFPLITCLLCVSQKQFFLNNWFQFAQLCMQQFKSRETSLNRIALEAMVRLIWVYMIRIKGEKSSETNQRLQSIIQNLFPKSNKLVNPKDMPASMFIKIVQFIAYEKLDFAMKEIVYDLLSIDVNSLNQSSNVQADLNSSLNNNEMNDLFGNNTSNNNDNSYNNAEINNSQASDTNTQSNMNSLSAQPNITLSSANSGSLISNAFKLSRENLVLMPLRMEIGLRSFFLIADTLQQQKETNSNQPPQMPSSSFGHHSAYSDMSTTSIYLNQALNSNRTKNNTAFSSQTNPTAHQRLMLTDQLAREIGIGSYFDNVRRSFQDIIKTLDAIIGRPFLMTRLENVANQSGSETISSSVSQNESNEGNNLPTLANIDSTNDGSSIGISSASSHDSSQSLQNFNYIFSQDLNTNTNMDQNDNTINSIGPVTEAQLLMKDLTFNSENKQRLCLMRTCISVLPRLMPMFKESELVDMLTRLTVHIDDELKISSFQTIKLLVSEYPQWRRAIFVGFTNFILKEISEMFPKLIDQSLKMLIQLLNTWKISKANVTQNAADDHCQIIFHLEGFALFNLCHSHVQRRRYALAILKECRQIGEFFKCFKAYPYHNYAIDVLDTASVNAIKQLHLQCFSTENNLKPDLSYLIDQSANWDANNNVSISNTIDQLSNSSTFSSQLGHSANSQNQSNINNIKNTRTNSFLNTGDDLTFNSGDSGSMKDSDGQLLNKSFRCNNIFTFDPWSECLAIFFSYDFIFTRCPQARVDAWPFIYTRLQQLLTLVDPNEVHEMPRTSILFGSGANSLEKIRRATNERDANLNLWKNYLIGACCLTSGSDRYLYYSDYEKAYMTKSDETNETLCASSISTTASAINVDFTIVESTSKFYATFGTATSLLKMIVPFLKCDCNYFREIVIRGLGRINIEAIRDLVEELYNSYIKELLSDQKRAEKIRRQVKKRDLIRLTIVRIFQFLADQRTLSKRLVDANRKQSHVKYHFHLQQQLDDEKQLRKTFFDFVESVQIYLDQDSIADKQQSELNIQIRLHFSIFLYKLFDSVKEKEKRFNLLPANTRSALFFLCDKWSGRFSLQQHHLLSQTPNQLYSNHNMNISPQSATHQPTNSNILQSTNQSSGLSSLKFNTNQLSTNMFNHSMTLPASILSSDHSNIPNQRSNPNHLYMHQNHYQHHNCYHYYDELELAALKACASLICCDETVDSLLANNGTNNSGSNRLVFTWLSQLLDHANIEMKMLDYCKCTLPNEIYMLAFNVCIQMLEMPALTSSTATHNSKCLLFDWIIQKCFTASQEIADLCYISLAKVYIASALSEKQQVTNIKTTSSNNDKNLNKSIKMHQLLDSHCKSSLLTLILLNIGSSRLNIHEESVRLLRVINKNYLSKKPTNIESKASTLSNTTGTTTTTTNTTTESSPNDSMYYESEQTPIDIINSTLVYSKSKIFISEYLSLRNSEFSLEIFCELTSRFEHCSHQHSHQIRKDMLTILVPWLYNIELIDPNVVKTSHIDRGNSSATELVLNNLFYLTCKFGDQYTSEFELIWAVLGSSFVSNIKIICRFLFILVSLATYEMLLNVKRVFGYLSKTCPDRILDELVNELEITDSFSDMITRTEKLPFFRYVQQTQQQQQQTSHSNRLNIRVENELNYSDNENEEDKDSSDDEDENKLLHNNPVINHEAILDESDEDDEDDEEDSYFETSFNEDDDDEAEEINSDDSDCSSKKKHFKYKVNTSSSNKHSINQILNKKTTKKNLIDVPINLQSYVCPLNVLLYHIGHHHNQQTTNNNNMNVNNQLPVIYSYHRNYLHHNHYEHISNLSRSNIALMILTDLFGQDVVDSDYWCLYAPCLFHYCLIGFDNTKQLIGEHAKKLFINLLIVLSMQCGLNALNDQLNEATSAIIDTQSVVFDRKYTNTSLIDSYKSSTNNNATCHYNYNFRSNLSTKVPFDRSNGRSKTVSNVSQVYLSPGIHRLLTNMNSAPVSPTHQLNNGKRADTLNKSDEIVQIAKQSLDYLLRVLVKAKNSPVWPYELITSQNYAKKLPSVTLINDFVTALQQFLQTVCLKHNRHGLNRITEKWSQFALKTALLTSCPHYAGRSLQINRALQHKLSSTSSLLNIIRRLKDTCTDKNESIQGFVVELLLTLKINASLLAADYTSSFSSTHSYTKESTNTTKHKSKSLNTKELKPHSPKKKDSEKRKHKSATAIAKLNSEIEINYRTLPKNKYSKKSKKLSAVYENSLTLSFFDLKWKILRERISKANCRISIPKFHSYFDRPKRNRQQTLNLLVQIFWTAICLLESDYDHEFVLSIEIISEILSQIDLNTGVVGQLLIHKNEFRTSLEMFTFGINWSSYPGVQNLLLKGCTCPSSSLSTIESTQRILIKFIPYCFKLNFIDPRNGQKEHGLRSLAMNLLALLPTMIQHYEKPTDLCQEAAQAYLRVLKEQCQLIESAQQRPVITGQNIRIQYQGNQLEQLKNLSHVMNLYSSGMFGKDRVQWTKCVITYLSEYFQQCQYEEAGTIVSAQFYFDWIVFLTELLDKSISNIQYQQCVFTVLNALLNLISFNDPATWSFINEELMRVIAKYMNTMLWSEALDLIRTTVNKSSSLTGFNKATNSFIGSSSTVAHLTNESVVSNVSSPFLTKKELPGRTLEFDFDISKFIPLKESNLPPLRLLNFHLNRQQQLSVDQQNQMSSNSWKRPHLSQTKTRERFMSLLATLDTHQSKVYASPVANTSFEINETFSKLSEQSCTTTDLKNKLSNNELSEQSCTTTDLKNKLSNSELSEQSGTTIDLKNKLSINEKSLTISGLPSSFIDLRNKLSNNEKSSTISVLPSPNKIVSILNASTSSLNKRSGSDSSSSLNNSNTSPQQSIRLKQKMIAPLLSNQLSNQSSNQSSNQLSSQLSIQSSKISNAPIAPTIQVQSDTNIKKSHHRTASSATIQLNNQNLLVNSLLISNTTSTGTLSVNSESDFKLRPCNLDDNNFINNTFSFLDDLDNKNDDIEEFKNKIFDHVSKPR